MPDAPKHIAIIMDGNGRWANARGLERTAGHAAGEAALFDTVEGAQELGVEWLTVYAFSTENWTRSEDEVAFLMGFNEALMMRRRDEIDALGIRVRFVGDQTDERIPDSVKERMAETAAMTSANTSMQLVFAFNYGGRDEIVRAARRLVESGVATADIDEIALGANLDIPEMPDVDLLIRTSGEHRISNFLLWRAAYAEMVFTDVLWPDFDRTSLADAIEEYENRHRRFGRA
ncbi:MAG: polyprenyl diphosphate synthase [Acidimicrobiia bacterium]|nr:polyprenyl diphosphate synthase [Acidimicrobiia bacterium]